MEDNLSALLYGKQDLRLKVQSVPQLNDDEVLIRVAFVGLCGTDISYYTKGPSKEGPVVFGHEVSGTVVKCGRNVTHLKCGDRVSAETATCFKCEKCRLGRYNICEKAEWIGAYPKDGALSRYMKHQEHSLHKLPDAVSMEEGAFTEPLSVAVHVCRRAGIKVGTDLLIIGCGSIGILVMLVAKHMGIHQVCVADIVDFKLDFAKKLGADFTVNVSSKKEDEIVKEIADKLGVKPDISIDCSGKQPSIRTAILATTNGGRVLLAGLPPKEGTIPLAPLVFNEIDLIGAICSPNSFKEALKIMKSLDLRRVISHQFQLEEVQKAVDLALTGEALKVMIKC